MSIVAVGDRLRNNLGKEVIVQSIEFDSGALTVKEEGYTPFKISRESIDDGAWIFISPIARAVPRMVATEDALITNYNKGYEDALDLVYKIALKKFGPTHKFMIVLDALRGT